jgi:BirA family biotin operon repressor/biotin-[acetyl-CoA-carboxylase] ligase
MGSRVMRLAAAPSTNDLGKRLLRAGEPHGTVIVSAAQSDGRGRRGRRWVSPQGGLWASLLARPAGLTLGQSGLLNLAAAVGAAQAASAVSGLPIALKWPNDLLAAGRKVGGVLVEISAKGKRVDWAVIGVGINANVSRADLPQRLRASSASLREEAGRTIPLNALLREVCARVERMVMLIETGHGQEVLDAWRALDSTAGRKVRASRGRGWLGDVVGIDAVGRLVVRVADGRLVELAITSGFIIE